jgi:hypothetical protein
VDRTRHACWHVSSRICVPIHKWCFRVQVFQVADNADDECKQYAESHRDEVIKAVNDAISATQRESQVDSLTDPAFFKLRKEPIEHVHKALMDNWDTIKGSDKALFVFISSLKNGIKTIKRKKIKLIKKECGADATLEAGEEAASGASKRRRVAGRKMLSASDVEAIVERVTARSAITIANLCGVVERMQTELLACRKELDAARTSG